MEHCSIEMVQFASLVTLRSIATDMLCKVLVHVISKTQLSTILPLMG